MKNPFNSVDIIGTDPDLTYVHNYLKDAYDKHKNLGLYTTWAKALGGGADCFFAHVDLFIDLMHVLPHVHYACANVIRLHEVRWVHSFVIIESRIVVDVAHGADRLPIIQHLKPYLKERKAKDLQLFNREQFLIAYSKNVLPGLNEGREKEKFEYASLQMRVAEESPPDVHICPAIKTS